MRTIPARVVALTLASWSALVACQTVGTGGPDDGGEIVVLAAASLTDAFTVLAERFEAVQPGTRVTLGFGGSQQLARQILDGAPADVFASADEVQMRALVDAGRIDGGPRAFASNHLVIAVAPGNPRDVVGLADLARPELTVVLAAPEVPAGRYAREALERAGVAIRPSSLETDVRGVLAKVTLDEADAGIVYVSDVTGREDVTGVAVDATADVPATYPIAVLDDAPDPASAAAFVDLVLSELGRRVLADAGFGAP